MMEDMKTKVGDSHKKAIAALIISGKPKAESEEPAKEESGEDEGTSMMAGEVMEALKSGNKEEFASSLKAMIDHCMSSY